MSTLIADGSSDNTSSSTLVHCPTAQVAEATWCACLVSPPRHQRPGHRRQRLRLPVRVCDGAGQGLGLLVLAGLGQRPGHLRQRVGVPEVGLACELR